MDTLPRVLGSLFQSVTPRTAGFNSVDLTKLSDCGVFIMIMLMLVGGSPGSTAGGMKTTTLAVILANAVCVFRHRDSARFFGRRVSEDTVRISFNGAVSPCIIVPAEGESFLYLILPVRTTA